MRRSSYAARSLARQVVAVVLHCRRRKGWPQSNPGEAQREQDLIKSMVGGSAKSCQIKAKCCAQHSKRLKFKSI